MCKYLLTGVVVLLVVAAFWLGTLVQSQHPILAQASETRNGVGDATKQLNALTEMRQWQYPGSKDQGSSQAGRLCYSVCTTSDDLEKVAKHYDGIPSGYNSQTVAHDEARGQGKMIEGVFNDSESAQDGKRPVRLGFKVRDTDEATVTIVVSRADNEKLTHIAVVYVQK